MAFLLLHLRPCSYEVSAAWLPGSFSGVWRVQCCSKRRFPCLAKAPETAEGIWWMPVPFSPVAKRLLWQRLSPSGATAIPGLGGMGKPRPGKSTAVTPPVVVVWPGPSWKWVSGALPQLLRLALGIPCQACPLSGTAPRSWAGPSPRCLRRIFHPAGTNPSLPSTEQCRQKQTLTQAFSLKGQCHLLQLNLYFFQWSLKNTVWGTTEN